MPIWTYNPYRALLQLEGKPFAIVTPVGGNALSPEAAETLLKDLNAKPTAHRTPFEQMVAQVEASAVAVLRGTPNPMAWSRRYICKCCGHKGRVAPGLRGPVVCCAVCTENTPARLLSETLAADAANHGKKLKP